MDDDKKSYFLDVVKWVVFPLTLVVWSIMDSDSLNGVVDSKVVDLLFVIMIITDIITLIACLFRKNNDN